MDRIRPYHAWPLGMGVLIAALPGVTVAIVVIVVALLAVGAVIFVARRRHHSPDPPLQNEVLGEWFEPEAGSVEATAAAAEANGAAPSANGKDPAPAVAAAAGGVTAAGAASDASPSVAPSAMRAEAATEIAGDTDAPTAAYAPHAVDDTGNGASAAAPAVVGAVAATNGWPAASQGAPSEAEPGAADADGQPDEPFAGDEFDYGSLERALGFTERTGGALAIGIASVILVVLLGLWLVAATHHGAGTPVHIVHTPIPGPPGPQGSPAP
jgi:hypothetical protein